MIRVTDKMAGMQTLRYLQQQNAELVRQQRDASSGQRLHSPSDDPANAARLTSLDAAADGAGQYQRNITRAMGWLDTADSTLMTAGELLQKATELSVSMANGTMTAEERQRAVEEVTAIKDQLLSLANTRFGKSYIFGGYATDQAPFDSTGAYLGDDHRREVQIDDDLTSEVGLSGSELFNAPGGTDVFATLQSLETALQTNDTTALSNGITDLEQAREQVTAGQTRIGNQVNALLNQRTALQERDAQLQLVRSDLADADAIETLSDLAEAQQALNATVQVSARLLSSLSLVDRL